MTIPGYSSYSVERVRRHHSGPPERRPGHQVPADWLPHTAGILHPEHLQQDEGDGERAGRPPGDLQSLDALAVFILTSEYQDKLYELDKSWENNLVFYGINQMKDEEERPNLIESRVREILR